MAALLVKRSIKFTTEISDKEVKSDSQEISTMEWQELKNRLFHFLSINSV